MEAAMIYEFRTYSLKKEFSLTFLRKKAAR